MTSLTCPKCRNGLPEAALDAGQCPLCGFPLDGPIVLGTAASGGGRLVVACGVLLLLAAGVVGYALYSPPAPPGPESPPFAVGVAAFSLAEPPSVVAAPSLAPMPHEPVRTTVAEPRQGPRPVGVTMKVDPKIAAKRHFDHPDDTAALPDLATGDRVTLTGRVRVLQLGSVRGQGFLDASGLVAEEIHIRGDLSGESQVLLHAPNGIVKLGGYVAGATKLTVFAPGGAVTFADSVRVSGGAITTVTAKRLEVKCPVSDGARVVVTLSAGGSLLLTRLEDGATVTYRKENAADPPPTVEKGVVRDRAKVVAAD